jgi:large subunit ribosomal protein L17
MLRNLAMSLLQHGRVQTTDAKAKEVRKLVERLITLGRRVTPTMIDGAAPADVARLRARRVHAVRLARQWVPDRDVLQRLFGELGEYYRTRPGGYTRITKLGRRVGDNAPLSLIELVVDVAAEPVGVETPVSQEPGGAAEQG